MWAFSSCGQQGLLSSCGAWASHCSGFPCCRAQAPGLRGAVVVEHGLSFLVACGIFPDQGSNLLPLRWQADSLPLSHQGVLVIIIILLGAPSTFSESSHEQKDPDIPCVALGDKAHMHTCCEPSSVSDDSVPYLAGGSQSLGEASESQRANNFPRSQS